MNLDTLPDRLLKHILSFIDDFADYFSIRITSKKLNKASKAYSILNKAQCHLFDTLITFVPNTSGHLDLSYQRHHLLIRILQEDLFKFSKCLEFFASGNIYSIASITKFTKLIEGMSEDQVRTICLLIKSIMTSSMITSLDVSYCTLDTNNMYDLIQLMKHQGLHFKLRYLNLDCNWIYSLTCIHHINDVLDDCELTMQHNILNKNRFRMPIKGVVQVNLVGNGISEKTILPKFMSKDGCTSKVTIDD